MAKMFKIEDLSRFQKSAELSVILQSPVDEWENEILQHALRMMPWLTDYSLSVDFIKKLPERRYGVGGISIRPNRGFQINPKAGTGNTPDPQRSMGPDGQQQPMDEPPLAQIPVVVNQGQLAPLDIFISGVDVLPLEEETFKRRMAIAPSIIRATDQKSDISIIGYLWPPSRAWDTGKTVAPGKLSSLYDEDGGHEFEQFLKKVAEEQLQGMEDQKGLPVLTAMVHGELAADKGKLEGLRKVASSHPALKELNSTLDELSKHLPQHGNPKGSVAQLYKSAEGYCIRATDPEAFSFSRAVKLAAKIGTTEDTRLAVTMPQGASIVEDQGFKTASYSETGRVVVYDGNASRKGLLFALMQDFDGQKVAEQMFVAADGKYLKTAQAPAVKSWQPLTDLKAGALTEGNGVFVVKTAEGLACTNVVTIHRRDVGVAGPVAKATLHGTKLASKDFPVDLDVNLYITGAVRKPVYNAKTASLLVPADMAWLPVGDKANDLTAPFALNRNTVALTKLSSTSFSVSGKPVEQVVRGALNAADAEFVLGALGVKTADIRAAMDSGSATFRDCNVLKPAKDNRVDFGLDAELLKSAAAIGDPNTVDAVLGLNLADFEIEDDYTGLASLLEQAQQRVAKLLLLKRLGLYDIPEGAAKVVMLRLAPVIDSLKVMSIQRAYRE